MKIIDKNRHGATEFSQVRKFFHSGHPSYPRLLDLEAEPAEELRVVLPRGANAGATLSAFLENYDAHGGIGSIYSGTARALHYYRIIETGDQQRPYDYGPPFILDGCINFITGALTIGRNQKGNILLHCHAGFINSNNHPPEVHGGHVLLDTVEVGEEPLIIRLCLFSKGAFVVNRDEETLFSLLYPTPMEL